MRSLPVFAVSVIFLFFSCQLSSPDNTILNNHSDREVTVYLSGADQIILSPYGKDGDTKTVPTLSSMNPGARLEGYSNSKKIYYKYTNTTLSFDFFPRQSYAVTVLNLTNKAGELTADGWAGTETAGGEWIEKIQFDPSGSKPLDVEWLLYSARPNFTARTAEGFPLPVLYVIDETAKICKVTIGN